MNVQTNSDLSEGVDITEGLLQGETLTPIYSVYYGFGVIFKVERSMVASFRG